MKYNKYQLIIIYIIGITLASFLYTVIGLGVYAFIKKIML